MSRSTTVLSSCAAAGLIGGAVLMFGAAPASAAPNPADTTFITANAQTNLAEITLGNLALQKATTTEVKNIATMTLTDHQAAMQKLTTVAQALGVTLPTAPNAQQQQQAATLQATTGSAFDSTYAQIQVAGHNQSIADTNTELSGGADQSVKDYANGYLPVAQKHLAMAQQAVTDLGGNPGSVPAGTGGQAATTSSSTEAIAITLVAVGGVAVLGAGAVAARRRRTNV